MSKPTGLRDTDEEPRHVRSSRSMGLKAGSDRRRKAHTDAEAESIARKAVKIFDNPEAVNVSNEDLVTVLMFLLDRGRYEELPQVMKYLLSENHQRILSGCCLKKLSDNLHDKDLEDAEEMLSYGFVLAALMSDPDSLEDEFKDYVSDCDDYESLKVRIAELESLTPASQTWFRRCISFGAIDKFCQIMEGAIGGAGRADSLRTAIAPFTSPEGSDIPATLKSDMYVNQANEIAMTRIRDIVTTRVRSTSDITELSKIAESYNLADVVAFTPEFRTWMKQTIYEKALNMAAAAISTAIDYRALVMVFDDFRMNDTSGVINDPEFKKMFTEKADEILSGYTDVRKLRDERRSGFTAPIDEALGHMVHSKTMDMMTHQMSACTDVQSMNEVMGTVLDDTLLVELSRVYSERAIQIIGFSGSMEEATANYDGLSKKYLDLSSSTDRLRQSYCDNIISRMMPLDDKDIADMHKISADPSVASTLANSLLAIIEYVKFDSLFSWLSFFESGSTRTNEVRAAISELNYAIGCGLLDNEPGRAIEYLNKVDGRDATSLRILAMLSRGKELAMAGQYDDARRLADESIDASESMKFAGTAFKCYAGALEGTMDPASFRNALALFDGASGSEEAVKSLALGYISSAFVRAYPKDIEHEFQQFGDRHRGESAGFDALVLSIRGFISLDMWNHSDAESCFKEARDINRDNQLNALIDAGVAASAWGQGSSREDMKQVIELCEVLSKAPGRMERYQGLKVMGYVHESEGAWTSAIDNYVEAAKYGKSDELLLMCARLCMENGDVPRARDFLSRVPGDISILMGHQITVLYGDPRSVKNDIERLPPKNEYSKAYRHYVLGLCKFKLLIYTGAEEDFTKGLSILEGLPATRNTAIVAVKMYRARALDRFKIGKNRASDGNEDFESALEILSSFSGNMRDMKSLWKEIESDKAACNEDRPTGVDKKFKMFDFAGQKVTAFGDPMEGGEHRVYRARAGSKEVAVRVSRQVDIYAEEGTIVMPDSDAVLTEKDIWEHMTEAAPDLVINLISHQSNTKFPAFLMELASETYNQWKELNPQVVRRIEVAIKMLEALAAIHAEGIVHNDVKPTNMFNVRGQWKIGDFGSSFDENEKPNSMVGTPFYMSPERISGGRITRASDVWSAGVAIYTMLNKGERYPFDGEGAEYERNVLEGNYRRGFIPSKFNPLMERALSVNPGDRPSAEEFLREFKELSEKEDI